MTHATRQPATSVAKGLSFDSARPRFMASPSPNVGADGRSGLRRTDGRLGVVPGASHRLHVEAPERVNAEVLGFLA